MSKWITVLAIEDDEIVQKAMERSLKLYGFDTSMAKDGPSGLKLAQEKNPELILLDWMMPDIDGLETLSELKHDIRTENIPVFMLTDRGMISDLDQAFEIGADAYITKPLDLMQIGKIVKAKWDNYKEQIRIG
jgi:DNA-binding response OmpR family regulator